MPKFSISIVSHGQASLIAPLLDDLYRLAFVDAELFITINIPEDEEPLHCQPQLFHIIRNSVPKGFGDNHNQAFRLSSGDYFIVMNPDIRLPVLNMELLLVPMMDQKVGAVAPVVFNSRGDVEDSVRTFPTLFVLVRRLLLGQRKPSYKFDIEPIVVDWAAGMFVVFRRESYHAVGGFDHQRFFMYLEDVDICRRLKEKGWLVVLQPAVSIIHDAQRASRRSFKHMRWHLTSAIRFITGF
jgi:N-acetylglucosaminyl-diphospho-decaprenol L-rhamnosyltransferase